MQQHCKKKLMKNHEWTETNEILYAYTKEDWALFPLFSGCYDNVKGRQLQLLLTDEFFPLQNMHVKKTCIKERKQQLRNTNWSIRNSNQTTTYLYQSSYFFQGLENIYVQFLQISLFLLPNTDVNTVHKFPQAISPKTKSSNFHQTEAHRLSFVNAGSLRWLLPLDVPEKSEQRWPDWAWVTSQPVIY